MIYVAVARSIYSCYKILFFVVTMTIEIKAKKKKTIKFCYHEICYAHVSKQARITPLRVW